MINVGGWMVWWLIPNEIEQLNDWTTITKLLDFPISSERIEVDIFWNSSRASNSGRSMDVSSFNNGIFVFFRLKKIRQTSDKVFNLKQNLVFPESSSETHSNSLALTHGYSNINKLAVNFISRLFPLLYFLQGCGAPEQTNDDSWLKNEEFPSLESSQL